MVDLIRQNQVLTQMLDEAAGAYLGINLTDGRALDIIDRHGRITAGDLARELRLSSGAVTTLVDRLERAGLARRIPDDEDRRRVLVEVTPVLQEAAKQVYGGPEDALAAAASFSDEEIDLLFRFQELSRDWLEERLARVEQLTQAKSVKDTPPAAEPGSGR